MVNLFNSYGLNPSSLDEVLQRKKDIEFSSKFHKVLQLYKEIQERIKKGYHDGKKALKKAPWMQPITTADGIAVYDMSPANITEEGDYE